MERHDILKKILGDVSQIANVLQTDLDALEKKTTQAVSRYESGDMSRKELCFWHKSLVRIFLAQVEGLSYAMRDHAARFSPELGIEWPRKKWEAISALDRRIPTEKSLALAVGSFSELFGVKFSLDAGGEDYRGFKGMLEARGRFTHPQRAEDLCPDEVFSTTSASMEWVLRGWRSLLLTCAESLWGGLNAGDLSERRFGFSDSSIKKSGKREEEGSKKYKGQSFVDDLQCMVLGLMEDTKIALTTLSESFAGDAEIDVNCAVRLLVATLFSEIEGSVFIAASHLNHFGAGYVDHPRNCLQAATVRCKSGSPRC